MDYLLVLAFLIVVPLALVFLFARRPTRAGGRLSSDRGITPQEPASDQPTPRADALNQSAPSQAEKIPPG